MRFFNQEQTQQHIEEIGGFHSEVINDQTGLPYEGRIERHHLVPVWQGGETSVENMVFADIVSHAILHLIADDPYSFRLIVNRMTDDEKQQLHQRGY